MNSKTCKADLNAILCDIPSNWRKQIISAICGYVDCEVIINDAECITFSKSVSNGRTVYTPNLDMQCIIDKVKGQICDFCVDPEEPRGVFKVSNLLPDRSINQGIIMDVMSNTHYTVTSGSFPLLHLPLSESLIGNHGTFTDTLEVLVTLDQGEAELNLYINDIVVETIPVTIIGEVLYTFTSRLYNNSDKIEITLESPGVIQ